MFVSETFFHVFQLCGKKDQQRCIAANFPDRCMFRNIFEFVDDIDKPPEKRKLVSWLFFLGVSFADCANLRFPKCIASRIRRSATESSGAHQWIARRLQSMGRHACCFQSTMAETRGWVFGPGFAVLGQQTLLSEDGQARRYGQQTEAKVSRGMVERQAWQRASWQNSSIFWYFLVDSLQSCLAYQNTSWYQQPTNRLQVGLVWLRERAEYPTTYLDPLNKQFDCQATMISPQRFGKPMNRWGHSWTKGSRQKNMAWLGWGCIGCTSAGRSFSGMDPAWRTCWSCYAHCNRSRWLQTICIGWNLQSLCVGCNFRTCVFVHGVCFFCWCPKSRWQPWANHSCSCWTWATPPLASRTPMRSYTQTDWCGILGC